MSKHCTHFVWPVVAGMVIAGMGGKAALQAAEEASVLVNKPQSAAAQPVSGPELPPPAKPNSPPVAAPLLVPPQSTPTAGTVVKRPFMRPAAPRAIAGEKLEGAEPIPTPNSATPSDSQPAPLPADIKVMPTPPIEYDTDHDARKMYRRTGIINMVVLTRNPADGCYYEIPLCVPGCCAGPPSVAEGRGLVTGRGVVEYRWLCGFRAIVKFRQVLGDVEVEYEGD